MAGPPPVEHARAPWRDKWYVIIFQHDTPSGRLFDIVLLTLIVLSVLSVIIESVPSIRDRYGSHFDTLEWIFTGLFTIEYAARLATARHPRRYFLSFFGIVDLLAIARFT
jgi:voltage-gated potassium channel